MRSYVVYILALITGGIGVFAYSPFDIWIIAYISLCGLIWIAKNPHKKTALIGSFFWGLAYFSIGINWLNVSIHQFGGTPIFISYALVILLSAYLSLYPLLFTYIIQKFKINNLALIPSVWIITEYLRGTIFTGFPWLQFGYTQIDSPFNGIAPIFGVEGLTFFTVWVSAVLLQLCTSIISNPKTHPIILTHIVILFLVVTSAYFSSSIKFTEENQQKSTKVTLLQGNIAQQLKWDPEYFFNTMDIYQRLIANSLGKTDIIILPEAAFPTTENNIQPFLTGLQEAAEKSNTEIIIGSIYHNTTTNKLFNSMINIGKQDLPYNLTTENRYIKHHLVPFGEYVPIETILRPLGNVFNLPMSNFQSGSEIQPHFLAKNFKFTPAICYEIIFGKQLQENITKDSDFILTLSNDAWFGDSIGPWQHLQMARMRALELGKPVIRATNTGITAFINAQGKIISQAPQFIETSLTHEIFTTKGKTPYSVLGNIPLYLLIVIWIIQHIIGIYVTRKLHRINLS
ncbi:apolipoprotein N-acyltransferase [Bisgaardia hudsonensis]|uniref:Apolipoprotein N-acyltransferase n=1 Tax=Bisgaardia hudsonensis TaxID=109472 RepID=A0A4R2N2W3_9PAST|nr:apolipoprotein N-acyltransferase [Bisgaardia hudsonensis]QLB12687.1 apolipoprotein N-acyltransferase [Bisgaardia hudsonensis]TCP14236.1 apolipoprotein N-acyltransferase [Bisgaardia hudsonensis]